jgi:selenoprotein W-related protein
MTQILAIDGMEERIESFTLIPSDGGKFEFSVNGNLLFSKKALNRHAEEGEVLGIFKKFAEE